MLTGVDKVNAAVHIVSKPRLEEFWSSRKGDAKIAQRDLLAWYKLAKNAWWNNWAGLKQTFGTADKVGDCIVFDVGNNRFRLIGRVRYVGDGARLYVLKVMDHEEYDRHLWVGECECYKPPPKPKRPAAEAKSASRGRSAQRRRRGT